MIRFPWGRLLFAVLAACFVFAVLAAETTAFTHLDHECGGAACPVCLRVEIARAILKGFVLAAAGPVFSAWRETKTARRRVTRLFTPVALNMKSTT
ncbi:MAG: hypothetical protein LBI86_06695 [Treponema sp.]|jgi:hypothetical protein|nr:hypothetical protein [Treponema sp.]